MPAMNTIVRLSPPPPGQIIPWQWSYWNQGGTVEGIDVESTDLFVEPQMRNTSTGAISNARSSLSASILRPTDYKKIFQGGAPSGAEDLLTGHVWAPVNNLYVTQNDASNRDAATFFRSEDFPYRMTLVVTKNPLTSFTVVFNVTAVESDQIGLGQTRKDYYKATVSVESFQEAGVTGTRADSYWNTDTCTLSITPSDAPGVVQPFEIFGEIRQAESAFDVALGDEGQIQAAESAELRIRYDARILAGFQAEFDGKTYTVISVDLEERYRFMTISLSRVLAGDG